MWFKGCSVLCVSVSGTSRHTLMDETETHFDTLRYFILMAMESNINHVITESLKNRIYFSEILLFKLTRFAE